MADPFELGDESGCETYFLDTFVLLMASNPMHSTFALSHALHAGNLPSHFCFLDRHRVHEEMARATLYCGSSLFLGGAGGYGAYCTSFLSEGVFMVDGWVGEGGDGIIVEPGEIVFYLKSSAPTRGAYCFLSSLFLDA